MTKYFNQSVKINHNPNWPYITDHLYRMLIIGGSESGKSNNEKSATRYSQTLFIC